MGSLETFSETAKSLSRNPLGIIALFIVLVYGMASYVTTSSTMLPAERAPLIYFLVFFPVLVLGVFGWLVSTRHGHLYAPGDFKNEDNFVAVVASLAAATAARDSGDGQSESGGNAQKFNVSGLVRALRKTRPDANKQTRILWVDDRPESTSYERQAFEGLGYSISLALNTAEALKYADAGEYSVIISDMARKEGTEEGYKLLQQLRDYQIRTPFFIYTGSNVDRVRRSAQAKDAQGITNDPQELFEMVVAAAK